ncbi:conserved hypothetical protein [Methanocaldococcus sp. FS406-22]|uniref:hypothetical protein n=1 Tax=Methanocaldococcus sp. (strain FS406-22) TaxID=644281 RepID=UPI0001BF2F6E|nr:hypothetical protein [Methanocaldococcus sp. FS406-22]ADC70494.1 conserved hypothetical protein [Methanocaldococcus sp. FS406-22]
MPMGFGMHYVGSEVASTDPFYGIVWMIIWIVIIAVIIAIIVYVLISPLKKQQTQNIDSEKLVKIEKDIEEIKEIVRELKKKWEEIE